MDYQKIYNNLINCEITRTGYVEKHHILPRCLGGLDNKENLIKLYPEEHYLAVTQDLADACIENIGLNADTGEIKYNIIGMDRHGVVAVDTTPWRAYEHIERLEHICKIVLASGKY